MENLEKKKYFFNKKENITQFLNIMKSYLKLIINQVLNFWKLQKIFSIKQLKFMVVKVTISYKMKVDY